MEIRFSRQWAVISILCTLVQFSKAAVSFSEIQLIIGFSSSCTAAYDAPVSDCELNDFRGIGGTGSCSSTCISRIKSAQTSIQRACSRQTADGSTLIGKLFLGEGDEFLCGSTSTSTTTTMAATETATTATTASTAQTTSVETSSVTGTTDSSRGATSVTATATQSTESTASTSTSSSESVSTSIESATSSITSFSSPFTTSTTSTATSSTTTSNSSGDQGNAGGGGSPFDPGPLTGSGTLSVTLQPHFLASCLFLALVVLR